MEDNQLDADLTHREIIRQAPHMEMDLAVSLRQARDLLSEETGYGIVLTDLNLPDGTGLELLAEIRRRELPCIVILLTGLGDEETAVAALRAGADDYLIKKEGYHAWIPKYLESALERFNLDSAKTTSRLRVLYAELDPSDAEDTLGHLARHTPYIEVELVTDAAALMGRLLENAGEVPPYDIILLGHQPPELDCISILRTLKAESSPGLPLVVVTRHGNEDVAIQALRLGASDYLVKRQGICG